jgi:predicted alpha/beta hydrolase family esterase
MNAVCKHLRVSAVLKGIDMSDVRVLILPGRGGSGADHWQTHWEAKHPEFIRVMQQEWDNPDRSEWVEALQQVVAVDNRPTVFVAHSLSVSLVNQWAQKYSANIKGALLVAPSDVEAPNYAPGTTGFTPIPLNPLPFKSIVIASEDDPRVSLERAQLFADKWGSRLEIAGALGHMGSASLLKDWPFAYRFLLELIEA